MFRHILVATDGSAISTKAARAGIALARALGAKVTGYCAIEPLPPLYIEGYAADQKVIEEIEESARRKALERLKRIAKLAKSGGVPYDGVASTAHTAYEGIIDTARRRKCDVIFMSSHGRRGLSRLVMGSVTQKVLTHSKIPVVVYR